MDIDIFLAKIAAQLQLGNILCKATKASGGLMHTMYKLQTDKASYAIKLLNPNIMKRPTAITNFTQADILEARLEESHIPIIPAIVFNNKKMQQIEGQFFYVYLWYEGKVIKNQSITKLHCNKISNALRNIHNIHTKNETYERKAININWHHYASLAIKQCPEIFSLLSAKNIALLLECESKGNSSIQNVPAIATICHNDMDCKNVLWCDEDFKIIDLECVGYSNPYMELLELALCWAGLDECSVDIGLFSAFMQAYFKDKPEQSIDWEAIYCSNNGRLEWLEYNVKRSLFIECTDPHEQKLGINQAQKTIKQIIYYNSIQDKILQIISKGLKL